jgi:hypothetical protein
MHKRFAVLASLAAAVACSADTASLPSPNDAAAKAVTTFSQLADSVARSGGDTVLSNSYASLAELIQMGGRVSKVAIVIDGVSTDFLATAQVFDAPSVAASTTPTLVRSLIAFNPANPKQIIQLTSSADSDPIRAYIYPTFAPYIGPSASLVYLDGKGGWYFGTSGTQKAAVVTTNVQCAPMSSVMGTCTNADMTVSFDAKAEASQFLVKDNPATGSYTLSMAAQLVQGARLQPKTITPPAPPIGVIPNASLPSTLTVKVDSLVNLTLTVNNSASTPAVVSFSSGKHNDFYIVDASTGQEVWRASKGLMYTQVAIAQTIAPNGTLTFTGYWKPTGKGSYIAVGELASVSHVAAAKAMVSVP